MTVPARKGAIAVLGAHGSVGRAAVAQLAAWRIPVVPAGRDPARAGVVLDVDDRKALERLCARCRVVVNCTGPSCEVLDRVGRVALASGAHYVDAGGDETVHGLLSDAGAVAATAVLSAGMAPGLTGLLPRALMARSCGEHSGLTGYAGGQDRFTPTAAVDYLASLSNGSGRSRAAWRNGQRAEGALAPLADAVFPFFSQPVFAHPYLSSEMERLARRLGLSEVTFFNVFPGRHVRAVLNELAGADAGVDAGALVTASEIDLFGREPFQRLVFQLEPSGGLRTGDAPTMVLSGRSASQLTGAMVALATMAVLAATVPPGVHFAADVLEPAWAVSRLREADAVLALETFGSPRLTSAELEEGVL